MKKNITVMSIVCCSLMLLSSCYTYTSVVGQGAQGNQEITKLNHYVAFGLAPIHVSDSREMAGDAKNYTVKTSHTFVDGLVSALTGGFYSTTTTTVTK